VLGAGANIRRLLPALPGPREAFSKEVLLAENASWIFRFTPYLVFSTAVLAGGIIHIVTGSAARLDRRCHRYRRIICNCPFLYCPGGDGYRDRFRRNGIEPRDDDRLLAEPAMLMAIFTVSLANRSTSLFRDNTGHLQRAVGAEAISRLRFLSVHIDRSRRNGQVPVDNPATHLELTMIHEAMILEYSGRHLALIEWQG